jgi:hypothetical protein
MLVIMYIQDSVQSFSLKVKSIHTQNILRIIRVDFNIMEQLLTRYSAVVRLGGERKYTAGVHRLLLTCRKPVIQLQEKYCAIYEFHIPKKVIRLIKMCWNELYDEVCTKYLREEFWFVCSDMPYTDGFSTLFHNVGLRSEKVRRGCN